MLRCHAECALLGRCSQRTDTECGGNRCFYCWWLQRSRGCLVRLLRSPTATATPRGAFIPIPFVFALQNRLLPGVSCGTSAQNFTTWISCRYSCPEAQKRAVVTGAGGFIVRRHPTDPTSPCPLPSCLILQSWDDVCEEPSVPRRRRPPYPEPSVHAPPRGFGKGHSRGAHAKERRSCRCKRL